MSKRRGRPGSVLGALVRSDIGRAFMGGLVGAAAVVGQAPKPAPKPAPKATPKP